MQTLQVFSEKVFTIGRWHGNYFIEKKNHSCIYSLYFYIETIHMGVIYISIYRNQKKKVKTLN